MEIKKFDIWLMKIPKTENTVMHGLRPVVILSCDTNSPIVKIMPMTKQIKKYYRNLSRHLILYPTKTSGIQYPSMIVAEQVLTMDKSRLSERLGSLTNEQRDKLIEMIVSELKNT